MTLCEVPLSQQTIHTCLRNDCNLLTVKQKLEPSL